MHREAAGPHRSQLTWGGRPTVAASPPLPLSEEEAKVLSQQHEWIRTVLDREVLGEVVQWVIMELYHMCQAGTSNDSNET